MFRLVEKRIDANREALRTDRFILMVEQHDDLHSFAHIRLDWKHGRQHSPVPDVSESILRAGDANRLFTCSTALRQGLLDRVGSTAAEKHLGDSDRCSGLRHRAARPTDHHDSRK